MSARVPRSSSMCSSTLQQTIVSIERARTPSSSAGVSGKRYEAMRTAGLSRNVPFRYSTATGSTSDATPISRAGPPRSPPDQIPRQVPEARADLQHAAPERVREPSDEPAVVGLELCEARQCDVADVSGLFRLAEPVLDDRPERRAGVLPPDLLPFVVRAAVVGDRNLVDPVAAPGDLRRDLRLDAESPRLDRHGLHDLAAEQLVVGLHVREVQVRGHVGGERQEAVADRVPEVEDPALAPAEKPRAVHDVGMPFLDRPA